MLGYCFTQDDCSIIYGIDKSISVFIKILILNHTSEINTNGCEVCGKQRAEGNKHYSFLTEYANGDFCKTVVDLLEGKCMTRYLIL